MKLEDELHITAPFRDEHEKVIVNLVHTYNVLLEKTLAVLHPFDLNDQHFNILMTLNEHYPEAISVGDIKNLLFNKRGDLTRLLDKLTHKGLVVREVDPNDRRVFLITISDEGRRQLWEMDAQLTAQRDQANSLSAAEAHQLNALLDKLRG
ncbi:MAG: MarR family transcriptional regulator [Chloroflexaceae bacterium]|nr:MarR family transcriptional regulator [Chloroflexaceae bacterium]